MSENPMWKCPECGILQDGKTCIRCGMTNIRARIGELLLPKSPENQAIFEDALCEDWYTLESRAEKAEAMVEKLIEAGNALDDAVDFAWGIGEYEPDPEQLEWRAIVAEWRKETNDD